MRKLINESDVNYESESISLEHATLAPRSSAKIPMLMGGHSDSVLSRIGRISDGLISYYYTAKDYQESWSEIASVAQVSSRDRSSFEENEHRPAFNCFEL